MRRWMHRSRAAAARFRSFHARSTPFERPPLWMPLIARSTNAPNVLRAPSWASASRNHHRRSSGDRRRILLNTRATCQRSSSTTSWQWGHFFDSHSTGSRILAPRRGQPGNVGVQRARFFFAGARAGGGAAFVGRGTNFPSGSLRGLSGA